MTEYKQLKKRIKKQNEIISEQAIKLDYLQAENQHMKDILEENKWLKKSIKRQQLRNEECSKYIEEVVKENEELNERISELKFLLELAKLHTEVAEGKMDKFVELKLND